MFEGFVYTQSKPTLPDGIYKAKILKAEPKRYNNGNWFCELTIEVEGHKGFNPNTIAVNDRPKIGELKANGNPITEEDCTKWDRKHSRFLDAFGIDASKGGLPREWVGHSGKVKCVPQYDKNEPDNKSKKFKELIPTLEEENGPVQESAAAPQAGSYKPKVETTPAANNDFPEDIPF